MSRKLTQLERRVLAYHGQPAATVSALERIPVSEVMRIRAELRGRGAEHSPQSTDTPEQQQLELDDDVDRLMRRNRAPRPT
jgi:hypothetical protein